MFKRQKYELIYDFGFTILDFAYKRSKFQLNLRTSTLVDFLQQVRERS